MAEVHDITTQDQAAILRTMAKSNPNAVHKGLFQLLSNGIISPNEAKVALLNIQKQRDNDNKELFNPKVESNEAIKAEKEQVTQPASEAPIKEAYADTKPISPIITPTKDLRTWDYGQLEGTPETKEAKAEMKNVIMDGNKKAGGDGESFHEFRSRTIPVLKKAMDESPANTVLTTHSSVLKMFKTWEGMGKPDINNMTPEQEKEFSTTYSKEGTDNGDVETFNGSKGPIHVVRHGQTDDNLKHNFRHANAELTDEGVKQAQEAGEVIQSKLKKGQSVPAIISSSLPRAIHTSNIIHSVLSSGSKLGADEPVQINDKSDPSEGAKALQGSYDRLIKAGSDPEDSDMKRMAGKIKDLQGESGKVDYGHIISQADPREVANVRKEASIGNIEHFLKHLHTKGAITYNA